MAAAVPAVAGVLGFHQHPVWRILRLTPHSGDDGRPLLLGTTRESGRPAPRRTGARATKRRYDGCHYGEELK